MVVHSKRTESKKPRKKSPKAPLPPPSAPVFGAAGGMPNAARQAQGRDRSNRQLGAREFSWAEFDRHVQSLARASLRAFKPNAVVGIAHGGVFVGGAIASALDVDFYPVRIARRSRDVGRGSRGVSNAMPAELKGKRVLLVDDVAGSGDGLEMAKRLAKSAGASKLATAALLSRPNRFQPDFVSFTEDTFFVFPWDYQTVSQDSRFDPDLAGA